MHFSVTEVSMSLAILPELILMKLDFLFHHLIRETKDCLQLKAHNPHSILLLFIVMYLVPERLTVDGSIISMKDVMKMWVPTMFSRYLCKENPSHLTEFSELKHQGVHSRWRTGSKYLPDWVATVPLVRFCWPGCSRGFFKKIKMISYQSEKV